MGKVCRSDLAQQINAKLSSYTLYNLHSKQFIALIMSGSRRRSNPPKTELSEEQLTGIHEAFAIFDAEKNGFIPLKDLKLAMRALGFEPRRDEINKLATIYDKSGTGIISEEDFLNLMSEKISDKGTKEEILKAFRLFDNDQTGRISFKNLKRVAVELGENLTDEELKEMILEADQDNDGEVNQEEFLRIMKKTCLY